MNITKMLLDKSKYKLKCPNAMTPEFIIVHNTANDSSAKNEIKYMISNNSSTGYHFAVDDKEVIQGIPLNRNSFNCGNAYGNRKGIAIEICYSKSGGERFLKAELKAIDLIVYLLNKYGWSIDKVTKHQDYSGKNCPHRTLELGWDRFIKQIEKRLNNNLYKINVDFLNYRAGAGTQYKINGQVKKGEVYTIIEIKNGWGKLKSGAGWINLSYCIKV